MSRPGLEAKTARGLVELGKKAPGKLTYASAGNATPPHLVGELFKQQAGIFSSHIPYRGAAPALQDVMSGQIDYVFDPGSALSHIKAGKVNLLGVASTRRSPFFPATPTLAEQGIRGTELDIWFGVWAPRGTSGSVIGKMNLELSKVLSNPDLKQRFAGFAAEPAWLDTAAFHKLLQQEAQLLSTLIASRKIKTE